MRKSRKRRHSACSKGDCGDKRTAYSVLRAASALLRASGKRAALQRCTYVRSAPTSSGARRARLQEPQFPRLAAGTSKSEAPLKLSAATCRSSHAVCCFLSADSFSFSFIMRRLYAIAACSSGAREAASSSQGTWRIDDNAPGSVKQTATISPACCVVNRILVAPPRALLSPAWTGERRQAVGRDSVVARTHCCGRSVDRSQCAVEL
jgi:hypothetical protein